VEASVISVYVHQIEKRQWNDEKREKRDIEEKEKVGNKKLKFEI
jgi:hypothetical protein